LFKKTHVYCNCKKKLESHDIKDLTQQKIN
jgi:hypothetical protein